MTIITKQLANNLPKHHELLYNQVVNPQNYSQLNQILTEAQHLTIYDITKTKKCPQDTIISVNDHINRTGNNPIRGMQKKMGIDFIDMTKLYKSKQDSVVTDCCGEKLNRIYPYPSHYLCNISILAKTLGIKKISAYLINIP